jgi:hypothetical protein
VEGVITGSMFCDDLDREANDAFIEWKDDKESRFRKCITCANRKSLTKPQKKKQRDGDEDAGKQVQTRPNRRCNESVRVEYDNYCTFAFQYHQFDQTVLEQIKQGLSFLDRTEFKRQVANVSNDLKRFLSRIFLLFPHFYFNYALLQKMKIEVEITENGNF